MDPLLISFAIKGAFRLGQAGKVAFEQHARNKAILLPEALVSPLTDREQITASVLENRGKLLSEGSPYHRYWNDDLPRGPKRINGDDSESIAQLRVALIEIGALEAASQAGISEGDAKETIGFELVAQWRRGEGPPHPWAHITVAVVDLALDFVSARPELIGVDGNAARVVGAIAESLGDIVPADTTEFDLKSIYGERLVAAFLKGALQGVSDNANGIFREEHLRDLATKSLKPIIAEIDVIKGMTNREQADWLKVVEAMTGPAAQAAIGVLGDHPEAFFGRKFSPEKAIGALTQAMLKEAAKRPVGKNFSEDGFIALFKAAVGVAAAMPELILGSAADDDALDQFKLDVFSKVMTFLAQAEKPFSDEVALGIAAEVLDAFGEHAVLLLEVEDDWDDVVAAGVAHVVEGFKAGLANGATGLEELYSREKLIELGRVLVSQIAATPGMIIGSKTDASGQEKKVWRKELKVIVAAVAGAMAEDKNLLLTADDWIAIAEVAARQAAANPGPLFGLDESDIGEAAVSGAISTILTVASDGFSGARVHGDVMFGSALRESIIETMERLPRNVSFILENNGQAQFKSLLEWTKKYAKENKDTVGSDDWLRLYKALLPKLLADKAFAIPSPDEVAAILES